MPGLLGNILNQVWTNTYGGLIDPIIQAPQYMVKNTQAFYNATTANAEGNPWPDDSFAPGGANAGKLAVVGNNNGVGSFGGGQVSYKFTDDVTMSLGGQYGTPFEMEFKRGDIITLNTGITTNPAKDPFSRFGQYFTTDINFYLGGVSYNGRIQDPYLGAAGTGRDLNGDGFPEKIFVDNHGRSWNIVGQSPEALQQYADNSVLDRQNWNFLPRELQNSYSPGSYATNDGVYTSAIGAKEWLVTRKPMNYSGLIPNSVYNVFNPNGVPSNYPDAYQFNAQGPGQYVNTMKSTASLFNGPATTTRLKVVDAATLSSNQVLTDLKYWLTQIDPATGRPHTFQNGILSSAGPWTATFQVPGATPADPPVDKPVINAYVNQIGELVVEYA